MSDLLSTNLGPIYDYLAATLPDALDENVDYSEGWQDIGRDRVMVMDAAIDQDVNQMPLRFKREQIVVTILIVVVRPGGDAIEVRRRAMEISNQIDAYARGNPPASAQLGGSVCWGIYKPTQWVPGVEPDTREGVLRAELHTNNYRF